LNPGQVINKKPVPEDIRNINLRRSGNNSLRKDSPTMFYPIFVNKANLQIVGVGEVPDDSYHTKNQTIKKKDYYEIWPIDSKQIEKNWYYSRKRVIENGNKELSCKWVKNQLHAYFDHSNNSEQTYKSVWTGSEYDAGAYGSSLVKLILNHEFPFPKSLYAVKDCLKSVVGNKKDAVILDFFAGSGTTGHAVLEINKEDNGKRQFILCTNNEDNDNSGTKIATDICYPRIKKVMQGYKANGREIKGLGGNLKYFSTEFVDCVKTDNDKRIFTSRCTEMLCLAEATFDEVACKKGLFAIYENQKQMTGIIFDEDAIFDFKKETKKYKKPIVVYVFSYDHTYNEEDFEDMSNLIIVKPIPEVILNVYRKIYKELYKSRNL
jgi:adenine-specific DNA-methyltransferase